MSKYILLFLILTIKNASADNMYTDSHARNELAHDLAECAAYTGIMGQLVGIPENNRVTLKHLSDIFASKSDELSSIEVSNFNIDFEINRLLTIGSTKGLKELIISEQPMCESLVKDYDVRYNYWIKNPRKSFLN